MLPKRKELFLALELEDHSSLVVHQMRVKVDTSSLTEARNLKHKAMLRHVDFYYGSPEVTLELGIGNAAI